MSVEQLGRYEIKSELGRGGMATVFLAHDPRFKRDVALKVMNRALQDEETFRGRFEREARTVASLEHPSIVPVYDYGEDDGQLYLVMRYMPGGSLSDKIIRGPLTLEEVVPIFDRIGAALDHAHQEGVIHRDLKPGNILFDKYNNAFLSDFGIVKLNRESVDLTGSGVIGTPAYMSPEQIHGDAQLDGRSDIYTLGIILYECLTGRKPYRADTPVKQMMAHVLKPVPRIRDENPNLPVACEQVIQKALSKEREDRYSSANELTEALTITMSGIQKPEQITAPSPADEATATITAVEPPQDESAATPAAVEDDDFVVSPPQPRSEEATHVGRAALSFQKPVVGETIPGASQPDGQKKRPWLWLVIGLALIIAVGVFWIVSSGLSEPDLSAEAEEQPPTEVVAETATAEETAEAETEDEEEPELEPEPVATDNEEEPTETFDLTASPVTTLIGESALGHPIEVWMFGGGPRIVLFVGGLHAGFAPGSVLLAQEMIDYFTENPEEVPENVTIFIIPNLNPDSADAPGQLEGRLNGNGVDLNRNWDCRWTADPPWGGDPQPGLGGSEPFSEPEVQAFVDFIDGLQLEAVVFWQARARLGLSSPGACAEESETSRPLARSYGDAADYPVADFEDVADTIVYGDVTNWLDAQEIPAISVLLPDYQESDFEPNLTAVKAVLEEISTATPEN